jgi:hypothetical protein
MVEDSIPCLIGGSSMRHLISPVLLVSLLVMTSLATAQLPTSFDWRDVDGVSLVSGVRSMQSCGVCFIFSPVAVVESRLMIAQHRAGLSVTEFDLSEQYILDCGGDYYGDFDCSSGGYPPDVFTFMQETGVPSEACYEYTAAEGYCPTGSCPDSGEQVQLIQPVTGLTTWTGFPDETAIMQEILDNGPVSTRMIMYTDIYSYSGGIYTHTSGYFAGPTAVTIVGWGTEGGTPYWIVKSQWNTWFGEDGFFRVARQDHANCDFGEYVYFASVQLPPVSSAPMPGPGGPLLGANHPNPFNPLTTIEFSVGRDGPARLEVYDASGRQVRTLLQEYLVAGRKYAVDWNGRDARGVRQSSGVYYYRLETGQGVQTRSMVLLK